MTTSAFVNRIDDPTNPINQYFQPAISTYTERLTTAPGFVLMCNAAASRVPDFPDIWDPQPFPADTTLVIARGGTAIASASLAGKQPFDFSGAPLTQALIDIIGVGLPQDCLDNNLAECTYFTDVYNGLIQVTGRRLALKYAYALVAFSVWLWYPEGQIQNSAAEIVSSMDAPSADEYCGDYFLNAATLTVSGGQPIYELNEAGRNLSLSLTDPDVVEFPEFDSCMLAPFWLNDFQNFLLTGLISLFFTQTFFIDVPLNRVNASVLGDISTNTLALTTLAQRAPVITENPPPQVVAVAPMVRPSLKMTRKGSRIRVSGTVDPAYTKARVTLQRLDGKKWKRVKTIRVTSAKKFSTSMTVKSTSKVRYRIVAGTQTSRTLRR
jgi:hypothetical protein